MSVDNRRHKTSWHWSCASRYCKASWKTEGEYYTLTKVASASKPVVEAYLFVLGKTINEVNFKRQVICTQHWPKGVRKNLEDPPSIKYTNVQGKETKEGREHWNCAAALCTNSWRTKLEGLQYYRLSDFAQCKDKQHAYNKVLMNKAVDFKRDFICSVHWSKGFRDNLDDLPDRACHPDYVNKQTTKKVTPQSKIAAAKRSLSTTKQTNTKRRKLIRSSCSLDFNSEESKFDIMQKELQELKEKLENKTEEANRLSQQVKDLTEKNDSLSKQITQFKGKMKDLTFSYECLKLRPKRFFYMSGLTVDDFNCVLECIEPYISVIIYPDCKTNQDGQRKLTKRTELLCYFTICRHTLHLGVMAFLTNTSDSTISRIFSAWSIFLSTLFDSIDLSPYPGEVISLLPKEFWSSGFQDTVLLGDCTENWISSPENYDVSSATFSNYKNHDTGKTGNKRNFASHV